MWYCRVLRFCFFSQKCLSHWHVFFLPSFWKGLTIASSPSVGINWQGINVLNKWTDYLSQGHVDTLGKLWFFLFLHCKSHVIYTSSCKESHLILKVRTLGIVTHWMFVRVSRDVEACEGKKLAGVLFVVENIFLGCTYWWGCLGTCDSKFFKVFGVPLVVHDFKRDVGHHDFRKVRFDGCMWL